MVRDEGHVLRRMLHVPVGLPGKRRRGGGKTDRTPGVKEIYMVNVGLNEENTVDRTEWKNCIQHHSGGPI